MPLLQSLVSLREGEKFLLDFAKTVDLSDQYLDNVENLEHIRFLIRQAGKVKWED